MPSRRFSFSGSEMAQLTLSQRPALDQVPEWLASGRVDRARDACELAIERAQARADVQSELQARGWLAVCMARRRDWEQVDRELATMDAAARLLGEAERLAVWAAHARVETLRGGGLEAAQRWWKHAFELQSWEDVVDAALHAAWAADGVEKRFWLERAADVADEHARSWRVRVYTDVAVAAEKLGDIERAHAAWSQLLDAARSAGAPVPQEARAGCALGAFAVAREDWPLAERRFLEALRVAESDPQAEVWAIRARVGLAEIQEAAGDVVEARRILVEALRRAHENALAEDAPAVWDHLAGVARRLELSVGG
jgi:tetratricopeptide (TPR) repeat protein